jgi:hypothetical protein
MLSTEHIAAPGTLATVQIAAVPPFEHGADAG